MIGNQKHQPAWTKEELEIVYTNYNRMSPTEMSKLLPNRSLSAVRNKWKKIKYQT